MSHSGNQISRQRSPDCSITIRP